MCQPACPRQESNLHPALRRRVLYPLSYEGRPGRVTAFVEEALMPNDTRNGMWFDLAMEDAEARREASLTS
jgi:hypothetical protein